MFRTEATQLDRVERFKYSPVRVAGVTAIATPVPADVPAQRYAPVDSVDEQDAVACPCDLRLAH